MMRYGSCIRYLCTLALLALVPAVAAAYSEFEPYQANLVAGGGGPDGGDVVGSVNAWLEGDTLVVQFVTVAGWCMESNHLHVAEAWEDIPQENGNPVPGQFDYSSEYKRCKVEQFYEVPVTIACGDLFLAAHADVKPDLKGKAKNDVVAETAWAADLENLEFGGSNWATYFTFRRQGVFLKVMGVRFRSFGNTGGNEIYLGRGDLGVGANRVELGYTWTKPSTCDLTFQYLPNAGLHGRLRTFGCFGTLSYDFPEVPATVDSFEIIVADRGGGGQVDFTDVLLFPAGLETLDLGDFLGNGAFAAYAYSNTDLDGGFSFTGTIHLDGTFGNSQELSRVEILLGQCLLP